jgi:hypothetical protein
MADNITVTPGTGASVAADDIGGHLHQRVKLTWGPNDTANEVDTVTGKPMPVQLRTASGTEIVKAGSTLPAASDPALVVTIRDANINGRAAASGSAPVALANEDFAVLGRLLPTATASGVTASRINAAATTNATSVKGSSGQVYTIDVFNAAAYNVFLKLYNKATAPTVGTDVPVMTIPVQSGGGFSKTWPHGLPFSTGIAYAITKLQGDTDTTAVLVNELTGNMTWI